MLWFEGNIVTDWKKAPNLPQMLFRVCKTNLEGMPNDPIIRGGGGGGKTSISFSAPSVSLKSKFTCFLLTNIRLCQYQNKTSLAWSSYGQTVSCDDKFFRRRKEKKNDYCFSSEEVNWNYVSSAWKSWKSHTGKFAPNIRKNCTTFQKHRAARIQQSQLKASPNLRERNFSLLYFGNGRNFFFPNDSIAV